MFATQVAFLLYYSEATLSNVSLLFSFLGTKSDAAQNIFAVVWAVKCRANRLCGKKIKIFVNLFKLCKRCAKSACNKFRF